VFDQAENRLHVQKAILFKLLHTSAPKTTLHTHAGKRKKLLSTD